MRTIFYSGLFIDRVSSPSRVYGIVMELDDEESRALYSAPSVREYVPETVRVELLDTEARW